MNNFTHRPHHTKNARNHTHHSAALSLTVTMKSKLPRLQEQLPADVALSIVVFMWSCDS